jgi:hypothetical protein
MSKVCQTTISQLPVEVVVELAADPVGSSIGSPITPPLDSQTPMPLEVSSTQPPYRSLQKTA